MSHNTTYILVTLTCLCFSAVGCDRVRTTLQPVLLKVTDSASGEPKEGVEISLKYDYERAEPEPKPLAQETRQPPDPEFWYQHMKEFWDEFPWVSGVTGKDGVVKVGIRYTVLDDTIGSKPPSWRDEVSGVPYLVKVKAEQERQEFSLVMRPGESVRGKAFTVHVLEIRQPRYVKTGGCPNGDL